MRTINQVLAGILLAAVVSAARVIAADSLTQLKAMAEQYEHEGLQTEAAATYEQIIVADATTRSILAPRLVELYAATRQPQKALEWARAIQEQMPDPQAYLAWVYEQVGGYPEAEAILKRELTSERRAPRRQSLLFQLAGLYEKTGRSEEADVLRTQARTLQSSKTNPEEPRIDAD